MFTLSSKSLKSNNLKQHLSSPYAGAFTSFEGWVRNHHQGKKVVALEYEAHEKLCRAEADKILKEAKKQFDIIDAEVIHRVGHLKVGDMAVIVGVTAAHRDHAFKACRYLIDEIKKRLPIWKKEIYANGDSGWVNCEQH
jgi:molybdopterin synthase catalytic subunit